MTDATTCIDGIFYRYVVSSSRRARTRCGLPRRGGRPLSSEAGRARPDRTSEALIINGRGVL